MSTHPEHPGQYGEPEFGGDSHADVEQNTVITGDDLESGSITRHNVVPGVPTQIAHKAQAVKRTLAVVVAGLIILNGVLAIFVEAFDVYLGDAHLGWIAGASAFVAAVITFLQRLILVEKWLPGLEKIGLGTGVEDEDLTGVEPPRPPRSPRGD